jgi:hypothetical protein
LGALSKVNVKIAQDGLFGESSPSRPSFAQDGNRENAECLAACPTGRQMKNDPKEKRGRRAR